MFPILLVLLLLGGLILFALQNLSPIVLAFLGTKSLALPLGVWILLAIAAGFLTSLVIGAILQLSNYLSEQSLRSRIREMEAEKTRFNWPGRETSPAAENASRQRNDYFPEREEEQVQPTGSTPGDRDSAENTIYERQQEPKTTYRSGSGYSYSYRNPSNSGVGRTESVYDAEYRIITPPYTGPEPETPENEWKSQKNEKDDDWGFDDDDDFDDDRGDRSGYR